MRRVEESEAEGKEEVKTKAKDRIKLANGDIMTLTEALDSNRLYLFKSEHKSRAANSMKIVTTYRYYAREGDGLWDINKTFYESRMGLPLTCESTE
jgi:hypothetical protein